MNKRDLASRNVSAGLLRGPKPTGDIAPPATPAKVGNVETTVQPQSPPERDDFATGAARAKPVAASTTSKLDLSPIDDLLFIGGADVKALSAELKRRSPMIREHAELKHDFAEAFKAFDAAPGLDALKALEAQFEGRKLTPGMKTRFMVEYRDQGAWADVRRLYEKAIAENPDFKQWEIPREYHIVALNKLKEPVLSLQEAQAYVRDLAAIPPGDQVTLETLRPRLDRLNGEVLAGMGKAFDVISKKANLSGAEYELLRAELGTVPTDWKSAAREVSTMYYHAGFQVDFEFYPGINVVYGLMQQGKKELAEQIAPMVKYSCLQEGGAESKDYWCLVTQLELALLQKEPTEVARFLPLVLANADASWKIDSTVNRMRELGADRAAARGDAPPTSADKALDHVVQLFDTLVKGADPANGKITIAKEDIAKHTQALLDAAGIPPPTAESNTIDAATRKLLSLSLSMKGLKSNFIGGNVGFGGQVPDRPVTRSSVNLAREVLKELKLDQVDDVDVMIGKVDKWLQRQLNLEDVVSGVRPKEDLHNEIHGLDDAFSKNKLEYAQIYRSGDSRTDLMLSILFGHGDCRDTGAGTPFMAATWSRDRTNSILRTAQVAALNGRRAELPALFKRADKFKEFDLRKGDFAVWAPILTEGADDANPQKGMYRELIRPDGARVANPTGVPYLVENHTMPMLFRFDEGGSVKKLELRDPWYQAKFPWKEFELDLRQVDDPTGFDAGIMGFKDEQGRDIPLKLRLSPYSGAPLKPNKDEAGQQRFAGMDVAPAPLAHFRAYASQLERVASLIASLDLATPQHEGIREQLTRGLDTLGERAAERLTRDLQTRMADPKDPFVAIGAANVVLTPELQKLKRPELERALGISVSAKKFEAIRSAQTGALLVAAPPAAPAADAVRGAGAQALPPMLVAMYLSDFRRGEAVDELLTSISNGKDAEALDDLVRLMEIARVGQGLLYNERAAATQTREMVPNGETQKVQNRTDFLPFTALTASVAALDEYELKPAANWMTAALAGLDDAAPAANFLHGVLERNVDAAAAQAHNVGWKASKDRDFANPNNAFVGWAPKRVRVSDELKALDRDALAARLGIEPARLTDAKMAAIAASPNNADIVHFLYKPYTEMLGDQADGGARMAGQNALALMTLSRYLDGREDLQTVGDLKRELASMLGGTDRSAIERLSKEKHYVFQAAQLGRGERGVENTIPAVKASGRTVTTEARTDFVASTPAQVAADTLTIQAAARTLKEALSPAAQGT